MSEKSDKRLNELEAKYSFQEDSIERLSGEVRKQQQEILLLNCLLYTSPSPRDRQKSRMPSSA